MNLIGHLACAEPLSEAGQAGALLPDLLSLFSRRVKTRPLLAVWNASHPGRTRDGVDLTRGVAFHEQVDRAFHHSPLFTECARVLREVLLRASAAPGLKRMLPAHVLTELYLDHRLVALAPLRERRFYQLLASQGGSLIAPFAALDGRVELLRFAGFLERLVQGRFLDDYGSLEGICWRMNRILARMGQRELGAAEQRAVGLALSERGPALETALLEFVQRMQSEIVWPDEAPAGLAGGPVPDAPSRVGGSTRLLAQGRSA